MKSEERGKIKTEALKNGTYTSRLSLQATKYHYKLKYVVPESKI